MDIRTTTGTDTRMMDMVILIRWTIRIARRKLQDGLRAIYETDTLLYFVRSILVF